MLAALVWLAIAFLIGRWVKTLIETVLPSLGFDNSVHALGVMPRNSQPVAGRRRDRHDRASCSARRSRRRGSSAAISVAALLFQITELGGKVIFGTVIIVVGLFLARILAGLVGSSTGEAGYAQTIVKYAIIALFTAIGLTFMGLADQIVMMAFGLILGSAAVATALAFGLGGRDAAARMLEEWHAGQIAAGRPPAAAPAEEAPRRPRTTASRRWCEPRRPFRQLRRDRLVGREGAAAQGHRDRRGAGRRRRRASSGPAMSGRARRCSTGC